MKVSLRAASRFLVALAGVGCVIGGHAATFRVATYNLDSYVEGFNSARPAKTAESKAAVHQAILAARPDVIALQEVGGTNELQALRSALAEGGLGFPHWELVAGADTNIHLAVLSRFPFIARRPFTNEAFLLSGRRFKVSRGFSEVEIKVTQEYRFTLLTAHLKSRRSVPMADEAEQRLEEARLLRKKIDAVLARNAEANLVVLGDLNDNPASASTKAVVGRGRAALVDTRPTERLSRMERATNSDPGTVAWTYYYGKEDGYSRIDYLLLSRGMAREWRAEETYVLASGDWATASDHRLLVAAFEMEEK